MITALKRWWRQLRGIEATRGAGVERRRAIIAGLAGVGGGVLMRTQPAASNVAHGKGLIRPPGSLPEEGFLDKCIRCSACMKACPTGVLQPAMFESGLAGLWTPTLRTRASFCEHKCRMCSEVCPTDAIQKISLPEKQQIKIGLAAIETDRCLPYAYGEACTVCYDICPVTPKAIWIKNGMVTANKEQGLTLLLPHVDEGMCIGCGACEHKCPVPGQSAIRVTGIAA